MPALPVQRLFIDGRLVDAVSGESFETLNPATGKPIAVVESADADDIERAVASAEKGFALWSAMTGAERGRVLMRAVVLLRERNRALAELEVSDTGKPIQEALAVDVASGADCIEYFAGLAASLARPPLELGGKSPLIIFADADLDQAVSAALLANFYTQGEVCTNGTRVFVERPILEPFLDRLAHRTARLRVGDPMDPATQVGALISAEHLRKVVSYIERGKAEGARLIAGGRRPTDPALAEGYFVEPTIFADCRDDMAIVREEIFGPVMAVLAFADEAEVIGRANATPFGLAAGVFTRDLARAHRVVAKLEAGGCWINNYNVTPVEMPFGGNKQSGIGRENGQAAIEHYTQLKSVYVELGQVACPYD